MNSEAEIVQDAENDKVKSAREIKRDRVRDIMVRANGLIAAGFDELFSDPDYNIDNVGPREIAQKLLAGAAEVVAPAPAFSQSGQPLGRHDVEGLNLLSELMVETAMKQRYPKRLFSHKSDRMALGEGCAAEPLGFEDFEEARPHAKDAQEKQVEAEPQP